MSTSLKRPDEFNWTTSKKLKLRAVCPIVIDRFSIDKKITTEKILTDSFKNNCKSRVGSQLFPSVMEKTSWEVNVNPIDTQTANEVDSIDVSFENEINLMSIYEQLSVLTQKVSALDSCISIFSKPHILNLSKEILLYLDRGDVVGETEISTRFTKLPKLKAIKIKAFADQCGIPFESFCVKANELINARNVVIHPPSFETLQARVDESKELLKHIPASDEANFTFEISLINNFSYINT